MSLFTHHILPNRCISTYSVFTTRCTLWTGKFFWVPPVISGKGKATNFQFCSHIYRLNRNKSPLKILGKVAVGVVRDSRKFSGYPYIGRIARSSLR